MYAWEQANFLRRYQINPDTEGRQEFGMLLHAIPKLHTHAPLDYLIDVCHLKKIDPRTGNRI
jgi:hypothetical protein